MNHPRLLLAVSMVMSFAGFLFGKGVYFYTDTVLQFSKKENLWFGLLGGATYVVAALLSHPIAHRVGEKRLALGAIAILVVATCYAAITRDTVGVCVCMFGTQVSWALFWPIIESYFGAGRTPTQQSRSMGQFNLAWAGVGPLGMLAAIPVFEFAPSTGLFLATAVIGVITAFMLIPLSPRPSHLDVNHPDRPHVMVIRRYRALLTASRWSLVNTYGMTLIVASLMPMVFGKDGLGLSESQAIALGSVKEAGRLVVFVVLTLTHRWHGRADMIVAGTIALPCAFFLTLLAPNAAVAGAGLLLFGACDGVIYFAALYYAMVVKNASVDAGGAHETLIGLGFTIGPIAGLIGQYVTRAMEGNRIAGNLVGIGPVVVVCVIAAMWPLVRLKMSARVVAPVVGE